ncbi:hypothetical protein BGP_5779 [Beggiatoa sp. PS]|nr:hypothetical protein BGP_5779 [Beggiatoa sp. PS]
MKFKTTSIFDKKISKLLHEEEYAQMRQALADNPALGAIMRERVALEKCGGLLDIEEKVVVQELFTIGIILKTKMVKYTCCLPS